MGVADRPGSAEEADSKMWMVNILMADLKSEVLKAMQKRAPIHSPHEGSSVIREEFEELWDHVKADTGRTPEARKEALQLAAMAVRYIVDLIDGDDRNVR